MNICLISDSLEGGGVEKVILQLATSLSKLGHRVDIIVLSDVTEYSVDDALFSVHILTPPSIAIRAIKFRFMANALRQKITEFNTSIDLCVSNKTVVDKICKMAKLPNLYFCIHGMPYMNKIYKNKKHLTLRQIIRKIRYTYLFTSQYKNSNLIAVSKGVENYLLTLGVKLKSVQTIYNPFDADYIRTQAEEYNVVSDDYIVHVGRFQLGAKRQDLLINAYYKSGIKQKLLLVGETDCGYVRHSKKVRQLVCDLGLEDRVIFVGFKSNPYPYIKNAKALVLSSDHEGLPTVLIEALILGVPVVSTDCPSGPSEILTGELSRFLSPVGDVEALSENIREVIARPPQISEHHVEKFDAVVCAKKYLALCE